MINIKKQAFHFFPYIFNISTVSAIIHCHLLQGRILYLTQGDIQMLIHGTSFTKVEPTMLILKQLIQSDVPSTEIMTFKSSTR